MKVQFHIPPVSGRLHGWQRVVRRVKNTFRGTLVVEFDRVTLTFAN